MHERRSRRPTLHERLDHLFLLSWRRHEKLKERLRKIMTVADDIKAALAEVAAETTAETDLITAIDTKMTGLGDQITALQQQIDDLTAAGGGGLSATDVADIQASIAAIKTGTDAVKAKLEITAGTSAAP